MVCAVIAEHEIRKRLNAAIDRQPMPLERERVCRYAVNLLAPEVRKLIQEEVRADQSKRKKETK